MSKEKYISLKEAAQLSGYSPDYVGQLIRRGKLPGKQVFLNVAWVTTEEALRAYMAKQSKSAERPSRAARAGRALARWFTLDLAYRAAVGIALGVLAVFILLLVYVLSVSTDHRIEQGYQQHMKGSV